MPKMNLATFHQIFKDNWDDFKNLHPSYATPYYEEVMDKMLRCGKEEGGFIEYHCTYCGQDYRRVAFSCKSSLCLRCGKVYSDNFVSQMSRVLQPGLRYRHMVLTIPEQLRIYFYRDSNKGDLLSSLMRIGYACLEDVVSRGVRQKVKIGAIVVVHTNGRSGHYNPHLHIIMTSGGINEETGKWVELGYFPYEIIHKKWQYHLFKMLREKVNTVQMSRLLDRLYCKYPNGLVAHVSKGQVPEKCRGLAKYLGKYVASPPIALSRIIKYTGNEVTYWYNDHHTGKKVVETVSVMLFIGRMVQHILPKGFQRVRYYGLQATKTFKKWADAIKSGLQKVGRVIKGAYEIVADKGYRERYKEMSGLDPLKCIFCNREMDLWLIWHPKYGRIYDEYENIKAGKYERIDGIGVSALRSPARGIQLSLFPLRL